MTSDKNNYPYLDEATEELEKEYPGIYYDESLKNHLRNSSRQKKQLKLKKTIVIKLLIHGIFYFITSYVIYYSMKTFNVSFFDSMIYGSVWFLFYLGFLKPIIERYSEKMKSD